MATERLTPTEAPALPEDAVLTRLITPDTAHIIGELFDPSLAQPDARLDPAKQEAFTSFLTSLTPEALPYENIEKASLLSRTEYWENNTGDFSAQNKEWNTATWNWMKAQVHEDAVHKEDAEAVFSSLGITLQHDEVQDELHSEVESFRKKYVGEKSDIKHFAADIAAGCMENGQVNLVTLEKRLIAIEGLLSAFGETYDIPTLIKELSVTHSLLTQPEEKKAALAPRIMDYLVVPYEEAKATYLKNYLLSQTPPSSESEEIPTPILSTPTSPEERPSPPDDEASEGYSPARRHDSHHHHEDEDEHEHDDDRTTYGEAGDNDPTTREGHAGDSDPTTIGDHSGDADPSTNEAEYVPGDSDSSDYDSDHDSDSGSDSDSESAADSD